MLDGGLAHGAVTARRQVEVVRAQGGRIGEPPLLQPFGLLVPCLPALPVSLAALVGGDQTGQVVILDGRVVVGVQLVTVVVNVQEEHLVSGAPFSNSSTEVFTPE